MQRHLLGKDIIPITSLPLRPGFVRTKQLLINLAVNASRRHAESWETDEQNSISDFGWR